MVSLCSACRGTPVVVAEPDLSGRKCGLAVEQNLIIFPDMRIMKQEKHHDKNQNSLDQDLADFVRLLLSKTALLSRI